MFKDDASKPEFAVSFADADDHTFYLNKPRAYFLDVFTKPDTVYKPMNISLIVPELLLDRGIPAAKICSIELVYIGKFASCAKADFQMIQRFIFFYNLKIQKIKF